MPSFVAEPTQKLRDIAMIQLIASHGVCYIERPKPLDTRCGPEFFDGESDLFQSRRRSCWPGTSSTGATRISRWSGYVLGVALLGLLDDMLGRGGVEGTPRGWRGHAKAVLGGRLSTGAIKAAGAFGLAAFAVSGLGREWPGYLADLALLLLTTNLFNLLDLRPGRVEKLLALLLAGVCIGATTVYPLELLGVFAGPVLAGAWLSLRERGCSGTPERTWRERSPASP